MTEMAKSLRLVKEDMVFLKGDGIEFISGSGAQPIGFLPGMSGVHAANLFGEFMTMKKPLVKRLSWKIKAAAGTKLSLEASSMRGGKAEKEIVLP